MSSSKCFGPENGGPGKSFSAAVTRRASGRSRIRSVAMLPVLLLCIGFDLLASGCFLNVQNISIILQQASINIVLASGMTFVILTGDIDLSVGLILATSAVTAIVVLTIPEAGDA